MADELPSGLFPLSHTNQSVRSEYLLVLNYLRNKFPYSDSCKGKTNPYTGNMIRSKRDYEEYVRQHALRLAYEKLFADSEYGQLYLTAKKELEVQMTLVNDKYSRLALSNRTQLKEIDRLKELKARADKKLWWRTVVSAFLAITLLISLFKVLPDVRKSSYENGKKEGYSTGQEAGYNAGYTAGTAEGYEAGTSNGIALGYAQGHDAGYSDGYTAGSQSTPPGNSSTTAQPSPISRTVYVSRNNIIHSKSTCSGMKYYTEMDYDAAIAAGYRLCSHCW